jgi:dihydrofolate reductase
MSKTFFDIAISLDGFIAGENRSAQNTIGDGGMTLHNWMFAQNAFWEHLGTTDGSEDGPDGNLIRETIARTGSCIMGKRMFEEGEPNWPENLFKSDVYVLTNEKREPWVQKGTTTFYFINNGIESAFEKAKQSAKDKDIRIMGGADTLQQFLNAGLVDEILLHITPVILVSGLRLFDNVDKNKFDIQVTNVIQSPLTTHLYYKLTNK